ncbi:hypothetical protein PDJ86_22455 [Bacillus cereus group sp. TH36-2LC]|uniref:hypothetical protein n=1 Tax=Bacillus cereus group sp. TH36-2LC TaxID=3018040 RepID=UPI0022E3E101|nr:hypothetical protein [Bacillus cereus group sp. TH36-2LC]MDA1509622.1 hypothetical protein [Bacillus cereus group sp. TH36-2LC]
MTNLQVATTGSEYKFWELFRYGEDKDIFEVVKSDIPEYTGTRYVMKQTKSGIILKQHGTYDKDSSEDIVVPYGVVTGATFKRVEQFIPVHIGDAMNELKEDKRNVFVQDKDGHFERITLWTDLDEIEVVDFSDLLNRNFFIKK